MPALPNDFTYLFVAGELIPTERTGKHRNTVESLCVRLPYNLILAEKNTAEVEESTQYTAYPNKSATLYPAVGYAQLFPMPELKYSANGNETTPTDPTPTDPTPTIILPDENPPLSNLPDEEPPLAELPEEDVPLAELPEEEVPLALLPATGDASALWMVLSALSGAGLFLTRKKREEV